MLKTVDVLIGFTLVMLIMSMAVTLATQAITSMANLRGMALKKGVANLLRLLDGAIDATKAKQISDALLRDPLIGGAGIGEKRRLASAVHREELTKLLLQFGAPPPAQCANQQLPQSRGAAARRELQTIVGTSLATNGIPDPASTLADIRKTALELERSQPEMANNERVNAAILHHAGDSDLVAKLNGWFDQTMDRVSERFTMHARIATVAAAAVIAASCSLTPLRSSTGCRSTINCAVKSSALPSITMANRSGRLRHARLQNPGPPLLQRPRRMPPTLRHPRAHPAARRGVTQRAGSSGNCQDKRSCIPVAGKRQGPD